MACVDYRARDLLFAISAAHLYIRRLDKHDLAMGNRAAVPARVYRTSRIGWEGFAALREELLWRRYRLGLIFVGLLGLLQLVGLLTGTTPYDWSSVLGIVLPLMFLEWVMTPLLMLATQRRR
jgi:hypothetical protein